MNLYPLLSRAPDLERLACELSALPVEQCRARRALTHRRSVYLATGASVKASGSHLADIAALLTGVAEKHGYPAEQARNTQADAEWAELLHRHLRLAPHQAAYDDMWHFMTLVLVPDLVRWRWGAARSVDQASDRWITMRYRHRNTFGRLWWRCEVLQQKGDTSPYALVHQLNEDELVQIMERPSLSGNRRLSRMTAEVFLQTSAANRDLNRANVLRDQRKRILRFGAFLDLQVLSDDELNALLLETFQASVGALRGSGSRDLGVGASPSAAGG